MSKGRAPQGTPEDAGRREWPQHHRSAEQRDAAVERAEADGQIVTEPAPDAEAERERDLERERQDRLPQAGGKLVSPAPPPESGRREYDSGIGIEPAVSDEVNE